MTTNGMLQVHPLRRGRAGRLPLVLLHGFPLDHRMWSDVVDLLAGDPTVLAPDLPGFGTSPSGPDVAGPDRHPSLDAVADAVAAALRADGVDRAVVGGLSLGGYVAMALVERHADLVAGLALIDTKSTADDDAARQNRLRIAATVRAESRIDEVLGMRSTLLGATNRLARPDLVQRLEGWIRDQGPAGVAWMWAAWSWAAWIGDAMSDGKRWANGKVRFGSYMALTSLGRSGRRKAGPAAARSPGITTGRGEVSALGYTGGRRGALRLASPAGGGPGALRADRGPGGRATGRSAAGRTGSRRRAR